MLRHLFIISLTILLFSFSPFQAFADKSDDTLVIAFTRKSVEETRMINSMPNIFYVQDKVDGQYQTSRILNINDDELVFSDSESKALVASSRTSNSTFL